MKKLLAFLLLAAMLVSLVACGETKKKSGKRDDDDDEDETSYLDESDSSVGEGTLESPLLISDADELFKFAEEYNTYKLPRDIYVKLAADIVVNDIADVYMELTADALDGYRMWNSIKNFEGIFDGDGHTIYGIVCCMETNEEGYVTDPSALFGSVSATGMVLNVTVKDSFFTSNTNNYVAGICGILRGGTVRNCHNYARLVGHTSCGGIVASNGGGFIQNCVNYADIIHAEDAKNLGLGGICGFHCSDYEKQITAKITGCVNYGTIQGNGAAGGIAGYSRGFIENCINKGDVSGRQAGGIAASNTSNGQYEIGNIAGCINYGNVFATREAGGIAAVNSFAEVGNQYGIINTANYGDVKSNYSAGGICMYINGGLLEESYNMGDVLVYETDGQEFSSGEAAGICVRDDENTIVRNCFNAGNVTASKDAVGICVFLRGSWMNCYSGGMITSKNKGAYGIAKEAYDDTAKIRNCVFIGEVTGDDSSHPMIKDLYDTDYGDRGFSCSSSVWNRDLALDASWYLGFDFETDWVMGNSDGYPYPTLRTQPEDFTK